MPTMIERRDRSVCVILRRSMFAGTKYPDMSPSHKGGDGVWAPPPVSEASSRIRGLSNCRTSLIACQPRNGHRCFWGSWQILEGLAGCLHRGVVVNVAKVVDRDVIGSFVVQPLQR